MCMALSGTEGLLSSTLLLQDNLIRRVTRSTSTNLVSLGQSCYDKYASIVRLKERIISLGSKAGSSSRKTNETDFVITKLVPYITAIERNGNILDLISI